MSLYVVTLRIRRQHQVMTLTTASSVMAHFAPELWGLATTFPSNYWRLLCITCTSVLLTFCTVPPYTYIYEHQSSSVPTVILFSCTQSRGDMQRPSFKRVHYDLKWQIARFSRHDKIVSLSKQVGLDYARSALIRLSALIFDSRWAIPQQFARWRGCQPPQTFPIVPCRKW